MYISPEGQQYQKRYGSRVSVWEGESFQTSSGLLRADLKENRRGKIVSKRRSSLMQERYKLFGGLTRKIKEPEIRKAPPVQKRQDKKKDVTSFSM